MAKADYTNPSYKRSDHPSFQDKKHTLLIDSQGASNRDIKTESGTLRFEDGVAVLPHDSRARDIYDEIQATEALHPNQYSLVENKPTVNANLFHRDTFGYSHISEERWNSIFGNIENDSEQEEINEQPTESGEECGTPEHSAGQLFAGT